MSLAGFADEGNDVLSLGSIVILVIAVVLLVAAVLLVRSSGPPWPAIVVAALASAVCFTVGGDTVQDSSGPTVATVTGSIAGAMSVAAAIITLVPTRVTGDRTPRAAIVVAAAGIAIGVIGLLLSLLTD